MFFAFLYLFYNQSVNVYKKPTKILIAVVLNLYINLGRHLNDVESHTVWPWTNHVPSLSLCFLLIPGREASGSLQRWAEQFWARKGVGSVFGWWQRQGAANQRNLNRGSRSPDWAWSYFLVATPWVRGPLFLGLSFPICKSEAAKVASRLN